MNGIQNLFAKMSPLVRAIVYAAAATFFAICVFSLPQVSRWSYNYYYSYGYDNIYLGIELFEKEGWFGAPMLFAVLSLLGGIAFQFLAVFLKKDIFKSLACWIGVGVVALYITLILGGMADDYTPNIGGVSITFLLAGLPWALYCIFTRNL